MSENPPRRPRVLLVTPEISFIPEGMGNLAQRMSAKDGVTSSITANLVKSLWDQGADIHVALPNYRRQFHLDVASVFDNEFQKVSRALPEQRIHLAQDRSFYHTTEIYSSQNRILMSLAFQREVINHTISQVRPDIIHCNNWMTGIIPAVAKRYGIPCVFSISRVESECIPLSQMEDRGMDAADFWQHLYYTEFPENYELARSRLACNLTASAVSASDYIIASDWEKISTSRKWEDPWLAAIKEAISLRMEDGTACAIATPPDSSYSPANDPLIHRTFTAADAVDGKHRNKRALQEQLGLEISPEIPLLHIPTRLTSEDVEKLHLTDEILAHLGNQSVNELQVVYTGSGDMFELYAHLPSQPELNGKVAFEPSDERSRRVCFAAADYTWDFSKGGHSTPSHAIGQRYGSIPIEFNPGRPASAAIADSSIDSLKMGRLTASSLADLWVQVRRSEDFFAKNPGSRELAISAAMKGAADDHESTAAKYIRIYESILESSVTA